MIEWVLDLGAAGKERQRVLTANTPFEDLLFRIRACANPPLPRRKWGNAGGPFEGAYREVWTITPKDREAVALFFNGRFGYRAAYAVNVSSGENVNRTAVRFFSSWLRDRGGAAVCETPIPLLGVGAKLWVPAEERVNCALISGCVLAREVLVPAWLEAAEKQIAVHRGGDYRFKAAAGVLAPLPTRLTVLGAWIRAGAVFAERVKDRGEEMHLYGYT